MLGTVSAAEDFAPTDRVYRIAVERSWKAKLAGTVSIRSRRASCLADLKPGGRYLVFAVRDTQGQWRTTSCEGNRAAADAAPALAWLARRR